MESALGPFVSSSVRTKPARYGLGSQLRLIALHTTRWLLPAWLTVLQRLYSPNMMRVRDLGTLTLNRGRVLGNLLVVDFQYLFHLQSPLLLSPSSPSANAPTNSQLLQRGRRHGPVLSQQVRALIGEGNQAYIDANIPETIRIMQEVIRIEPRAASAWSVLAQCYEDVGEPGKTLQLRIMAAHLNHDADEWADLARQSR